MDWHSVDEVYLYSDATTSKIARTVTQKLGFSKGQGSPALSLSLSLSFARALTRSYSYSVIHSHSLSFGVRSQPDTLQPEH